MNDHLSISREGDVVLVYYQDKPSIYARIEVIEPDIKKDWYQVTLLLLSIPSQVVTWILREEYINGAGFTMGGQSMRLEKVKGIEPQAKSHGDEKHSKTKGKGKNVKIIPFKKQT